MIQMLVQTRSRKDHTFSQFETNPNSKNAKFYHYFGKKKLKEKALYHCRQSREALLGNRNRHEPLPVEQPSMNLLRHTRKGYCLCEKEKEKMQGW